MDSGQIRLGNKTILMREHHDEDYVSLFCGLICSLFCVFFKAIIIWLSGGRKEEKKRGCFLFKCLAKGEGTDEEKSIQRDSESIWLYHGYG